MGKVDDAAVVVVFFDDIKFKLGVDNNPLPLAVKAAERGATAMASSADRRPMCIIMSSISQVSFLLLLVRREYCMELDVMKDR